MRPRSTLHGKTNRRYVAEGFKEDALKILRQFSHRKQYTLPDFMKLWNENHMSLIYMGRTSSKELCEFTNECFALIIDLLRNPDSPIDMQIGAIYLLYCLYGSQPFEKYKIRVTIRDYSLICSLLPRAKEAKLTSLAYAILKLKHIPAFHFVGNITLMGPEIQGIRTPTQEHALSIMVDNRWNEFIRDFCRSDPLQEYKHIDSIYEKTKRALGYLHDPREATEDGPNAECMRMLQNVAHGDTDVSRYFDIDNHYPGEHGGNNIGARRTFLKQQQMETCAASSRFPVSKQETESLADSDGNYIAPSSVKARRGKPRKKSKREITDLTEEELDELGLSIEPALSDSSYSSKKSNIVAKQSSKDEIQSTIEEVVSGAFDDQRETQKKQWSLRSRLPSKNAPQEVVFTDQEVSECTDISESEYEPGKEKAKGNCEFAEPKVKEVKKKLNDSTDRQAQKEAKRIRRRLLRRGRQRKRRCLLVEKPVKRRIGKGKKLRRHYDTSDDELLEENEELILKSDDDVSFNDEQNHSDIDGFIALKVKDDPDDDLETKPVLEEEMILP